MSQEREIVRTSGGKFAPGHSGNPEGGRLIGARGKATLSAQQTKRLLFDFMGSPDPGFGSDQSRLTSYLEEICGTAEGRRFMVKLTFDNVPRDLEINATVGGDPRSWSEILVLARTRPDSGEVDCVPVLPEVNAPAALPVGEQLAEVQP